MDDTKFRKSLKVTFLYVFIGVPLRLAFALFIAMDLEYGFESNRAVPDGVLSSFHYRRQRRSIDYVAQHLR